MSYHRPQVKALEAQLEGREREVQALQMALHHCEMDVVRMRAVVDSVAQVLYIRESHFWRCCSVTSFAPSFLSYYILFSSFTHYHQLPPRNKGATYGREPLVSLTALLWVSRPPIGRFGDASRGVRRPGGAGRRHG